MKLRMFGWTAIFVSGLVLALAAAAADEAPDAAGSAEPRAGHAEGPRDAHLRTPRPPGPRRRAELRSRDGHVSVQVNVDEFGANIVGDAANEPSIAVDPTDPTRMAIGWRQFDSILSDFRQAGWGHTTDGGNTWSFPGVIEPGVFRSDPVVDSDADGNFFYNSLTADAGPSNFRCHVFRSTDGAATWDAGVYAWGGDKQWQVIDTTDGPGRGNVYASWNSFFSACSGNFTRSYDGGQTFLPCTTVAGDPYWGTLAVGPDGELYVSGTGMTIAKSTTMQNPALPAAWDFSRTVDLDGSLAVSAGPNPGGLLGQNWVVVDSSDGPTRGHVYMLASVNRSSNPDPLDVMFARSTDGGVTWSAPVRVNDDPGTSAWQWFGTLSVAPNGRLDAIWLDTRNDPGGYDSELYYSYSTDGGVTWSPNEALSPPFDPHVGWPQQNKLGDYFDMTSDEFGANLAYAATFNGEQDVYYIRIGDPACPDAGRLTLDRPKYSCDGTVNVSVLDCGLNADDEVAESVTVDVDSDSETGFETPTLTETHPSSALFEGAIDLSETDDDGVLLVVEGDTIAVTYVDADDGAGGTGVPVLAAAQVECTPPVISNVQALEVGPFSATVTFDADEPVRGAVRHGLSCDALDATTVGSGFSPAPTVRLLGLSDATVYFYVVEAEDEAGNVAGDDNGGGCHTFATPDVPDSFTEQFTAGVDLDGLKLTFTPDGSLDFYAACVEPITALPTDPAGGTVLVLGDDDDEQAVLTGDAKVYLYGIEYPSFWIVSNGYLTFAGGETSYLESYSEHFSVARVSALFDDLTGATGTISWRQLDDRAVATWEDVPELSAGGSNTFQIELFFDGRITISYLGISAADAIAGLSAGTGLPPGFYPSDLSALGSCGPRPPTAASSTVYTDVGTPVAIELQASDDGLPADPGALSYTIVGLPTGGSLEDPGAGSIVDVPYTLAADGDSVLYVPAPGHEEADSFQFRASDGGAPPEGGSSNAATVTVVQGGVQLVHEFPFDADPGWTTEGGWAFGTPTGGGTHAGDPTSGATGANVYGYNLQGDYPNGMAAESLTSAPVDLTGVTETRIEFQRWLGVESANYDHAALQASTDGVVWTTIWNHSGASISESAWSLQSYDVAAVADDRPAVSFRWVMGTTDGSVTYPGWNIDDVRIRGRRASPGCVAAPGEAGELILHADKQSIDWMPPVTVGGAAPVYDVIRSATRDDFLSLATCVETDDGGDTIALDPQDPPPQVVFYYLVRAENACGAGTAGQTSGGVERAAVACGP